MLLKHKHTFKAKDEISKLGGKWDKQNKGWFMPDKESYDEALKFCDAFNEPEFADSDEHEDYEGHRKWTLTTEQKESVDWMFPKFHQDVLDQNPIPLKDNIGKKATAGLTFKGRGKNPRHTWIVTAFKADWDLLSNNKNSFCCINLETLSANFLTEEQIKQHVWCERLELGKAQDIYSQFVTA